MLHVESFCNSPLFKGMEGGGTGVRHASCCTLFHEMDNTAGGKVGRLIAVTRDDALVSSLRAIEPSTRFSVEVLSTGMSLARRVPSLGSWEPPAVILLDDDLPDMKGHELVEDLRRIRNDLKIIFLAYHPTPVFEVEVRRSGVYTFLVKPVESVLLMRIVEKALEHTTSRVARRGAGKGERLFDE